ncbi:hypothetical protein B4U80_13214 [Leptotrombidium deliense]|uniref:FCP1 homology domain-containing protein n=1 Tax=Leptotrombidium deliense TaxID=299467 RepID=A0A443SA95_9ACAR|nr:hypothetical protein B4U80_13214 [Leptotrombidium deliense]
MTLKKHGMFPLILVVDLDETLIFFDEENILKREYYTLFYRPEMYTFFEYLRIWFRDNILLVLWSTGENLYVHDILNKLHLHYFDIIYGRKESDESEIEFDARKSIRYLKQNKCVQRFLLRMYNKWESLMLYTKFAIVDDKCDDNVDDLAPYDYMFPVKPLNLRSLFIERCFDLTKKSNKRSVIIDNGLFCVTQSLFAFADFLVYNCIVSDVVHGGKIHIGKITSTFKKMVNKSNFHCRVPHTIRNMVMSQKSEMSPVFKDMCREHDQHMCSLFFDKIEVAPNPLVKSVVQQYMPKGFRYWCARAVRNWNDNECPDSIAIYKDEYVLASRADFIQEMQKLADDSGDCSMSAFASMGNMSALTNPKRSVINRGFTKYCKYMLMNYNIEFDTAKSFCTSQSKFSDLRDKYEKAASIRAITEAHLLYMSNLYEPFRNKIDIQDIPDNVANDPYLSAIFDSRKSVHIAYDKYLPEYRKMYVNYFNTNDNDLHKFSGMFFAILNTMDIIVGIDPPNTIPMKAGGCPTFPRDSHPEFVNRYRISENPPNAEYDMKTFSIKATRDIYHGEEIVLCAPVNEKRYLYENAFMYLKYASSNDSKSHYDTFGNQGCVQMTLDSMRTPNEADLANNNVNEFYKYDTSCADFHTRNLVMPLT